MVFDCPRSCSLLFYYFYLIIVILQGQKKNKQHFFMLFIVLYSMYMTLCNDAQFTQRVRFKAILFLVRHDLPV